MMRRRKPTFGCAVVAAVAFVLAAPASAQDYDNAAEELGSPFTDNTASTEEPSDADLPSAGPPPTPVAQAPDCVWTTYDVDDEGTAYGLGYALVGAGIATLPERPSEDHVLQLRTCDEPGWEPSDADIRWVDPDPDADAGLDEAAVAAQLGEDLYARVTGNLPEPEITANPPEGQSWIVGAPTFVRIDNWEDHASWDDDGVFRDQECDDDSDDFCSFIEATPSMVFDPGDGTGPIDCQAPGVLFDGTTNEEVFETHRSSESCSHIYELRSGVGGRPEEFPGVVQIVWELDWWDDTGASGSYDPITHEATLSRDINDVGTVVTG